MRWLRLRLGLGLWVVGCGAAASPPASEAVAEPETPPASNPVAAASVAPDPVSTAAPEPEPIEKALFAPILAERFCAATNPCCAAVDTRYDEAHCREKVTESWTEVVAKATAYDAQQAARCVERAAELAAGCNVGRGDIMDDAACGRVFDGDGALGDRCENATDCAFATDGTAFCWKGAMADEPGRCALETKGEAGAACFSHDVDQPDLLRFSDCSDGAELRCDDAKGVCVPKAAVGEACKRSRDCTKPARCSGGRCVDPTGQACATSRDCGSGQRCRDGVCGAGGKLGEPCNGLLDCGPGTQCAAATRTCSTHAGTFFCVKR